MSSKNSFAPKANIRGQSCPASCCCICRMTTRRVKSLERHSRSHRLPTAIFVLEDDAQDGADHVDAHRSIAFVISKYSPGPAEQPYLAHPFYTTVNMIHTMEVLLGLPPMNQNDAYAPVMGPLFSGRGDQKPFAVDWRNRDNGLIYRMNPPRGRDSE